MTVLVLRGLQEAHRRQVPGLERGVEVGQVVVVVRLVGVADRGDRRRRQVLRVRRRLVVLERRVVRAVVDDRDAAEGLRGTWLLVDSATIAPPDDPDEFNDTDLIGLAVRTVDGTAVGAVDDVLHPAQDVLVVKTPDAREIMIPFVKAIVPEVDVKSGVLVIDPPEGLLNLEGAP